jgi:4-hydroxybenzoate polyprenyltransferase
MTQDEAASHAASEISDEQNRTAGSSPLLAWLQLFRLPNVFTAMADIVAGFVFVRGDDALNSWPALALLLAASSLLYTAGMVLNDVFDFDQDLKERPFRPLPSGRISRLHAARVGWGMLLAGVALGWAAGFVPLSDPIALSWRSGVMAMLIAVCVVAYDAVTKRTVIGPLFMGACRFFNVLLGMSVAGMIACTQHDWLLRYMPGQLLVAGGIGVYIIGVTIFARTEAVRTSIWRLLLGLAVMIGGVAMIAGYGQLFPDEHRLLNHFLMLEPVLWQLLVGLIGFTIVRRCLMAIMDPSPQQVQVAVKLAIMSLIMLDAAIAMAVNPYWAIGVLALLAPMLLLGIWVYST